MGEMLQFLVPSTPLNFRHLNRGKTILFRDMCDAYPHSGLAKVSV